MFWTWYIRKLLDDVKAKKAATMFTCDACGNHWESLKRDDERNMWVCSPCRKKQGSD